MLPVILLGVLTGLAGFIFREQLLPATPVETARVALLETETGESALSAPAAAGMLFQASGWLEPDPWPIRVATLTDGFVESMWVEAGDAVTNGQAIAQLDATDNRLALEAALLDQQVLEATLTEHRASIEPVIALAAAAKARRRKASARLKEAEDTLRRIEGLVDRDTAPTERIAARRTVAERDADLAVAEAEILELDKRIAAMEQTCARLDVQIDLAAKQAAIERLALDRTLIRAPMDGRVLRRFAEPGAKRMARMDDPNSATLVSLYDPARLQVRVDVPLSEAGRVTVGMPARISTAMVPDRSFSGTVTRIVGEADLQRNTLQVKVALIDPDPRMRPEVLCRVEFRGEPSTGEATGGPSPASGRRSLWVPATALADASAETTRVWVVDPDTYRASPVEVQVAGESRDGFRLVRQGLLANQWIVTNGWQRLKPGGRVRPIHEEVRP